jgi:phospholipase A1/A2
MSFNVTRWVVGIILVWLSQVSAQAQGINECLLEALEKAAPTATVEQVRQTCLGSVKESNPEKKETAIKQDPSAAQTTQNRAAALVMRPTSELSVFERRQASELRAMREPFALLPHRPNFLLPITRHTRPSDSASVSGADKNFEALFQTSFKFPLSRPLFGGAVWPFFAYTGRAWWQVYDNDRSSPFREYNHEPEFLLGLPGSSIEFYGWKHRLSVLGFNHQSNGRTEPGSRSWNRLTAEVFLDRGKQNWASLKLWTRLGERSKEQVGSEGDDNPDISRYLGHFEFKTGRVYENGNQLSAMIRRNLGSRGKGALQIDLSIPTRYAPSVRWYVHGFTGYGESLIDYNVKINRVGAGIMLNDWF